MGQLNNQYVFKYSQLYKSWNKGKSSPIVKFHAHEKDPRLCVVKCIDEYLLRSNSWRSGGKTKLLLSSICPHKKITSSTVSKWIKDILVLPGVIKFWDFSAHSTRSAATSKTDFFGLIFFVGFLVKWIYMLQNVFQKDIVSNEKNILGKSFWL